MIPSRHPYRHRANLVVGLLLLLHVPAVGAVASAFQVDQLSVLGLALAILAAPAVCLALRPGSRLTSIALGIACMCFSSLLIHAARGMIEMHFHIFAAIAALVALGDWLVILVAAGTIAAHHTLFFFLLPASVFNYAATFATVMVHAVFVVLTAAPAALISRKFNQFITAQETVSSHLPAFTDLVSASSSRLDATSRRLAETAASQATTLQRTAASLRAMAGGTEETAGNVRHAAALATETSEIADTGAAEMQEMHSAMADVQNASDDIASIIKTINGIASQTNLLAINAAVEAARAGEAGLGFAVVADEVRVLAQRCAGAAQETSARIERSVNNSQRAAEMTARVRNRFSHIVRQSRKVRDLITGVSHVAEQQNDSLREVSATLSDLERATEANSADARDAAGEAGHLAAHADGLRNTVSALQALVGGGNRLPSTATTPEVEPAPQPQRPSRPALTHETQHRNKNHLSVA